MTSGCSEGEAWFNGQIFSSEEGRDAPLAALLFARTTSKDARHRFQSSTDILDSWNSASSIKVKTTIFKF